MWQLIAHRVLRLLLILFIVSLITFAIVNIIPGDVAAQVLGSEATEEQLASFRAEHGFDAPLYERYFTWVGNALQGDFGQSLRTRQDVTDAIRERLPVSFELMLLTQVLALVIAVPMATYAAYRRDRLFDRASTVGAFGVLSIPNFMIALFLIYLFAVKLHWLPATGFSPMGDGVWENLRTMVLPVLTLAGTEVAVYQRLLRRDIIATLKEDHIAFARAKGLPTSYVLTHHVLRLSSFSVLTLVGLNIGRLLGGAVVVEQLFALPGVGRLLIQAIGTRDVFMIQGVVLFTALVYVVVNMIVDILYGILDPRSLAGRTR
jgi:peptide/nickel transport system permease protein